MSEPIKFNTFESPQKWFRFSYPDYWETMVVEGIPAFFDSNGGGVLQVYSFENKQEPVNAENELKNYLSVHKIEYDENLVARFQNTQGTEIVSCEFLKEDRHWCVYSLANGKRLFLGTFNSDEKITDGLYSQLSQIIGSVIFL